MRELTLQETKKLLSIHDNSKDDYIHAMQPIVIEFVRDYCQDPLLPIESGVRIAVVKIVEFYMDNSRLQSRSISRLRESFASELPPAILELLSPYDKSNKVIFL